MSKRMAAWLVIVGGLGCGAGTAEPTATTEPTTATSAPAPTGAHAAQGLAAARALAVGESVQLEVGCEGAVYLGPFAFASDGQAVTLEGTHTAQAQTCLGANFVDASDAFVAVGGFGCSDGGQTSTAEASYEYSPGNGGNAASPVFVKVAVGDPRPEPCAPSRVTVRRTR